MTVRYCPRCATDVEDVGGFCLLGHRLIHASVSTPPQRQIAAPTSLVDLRAEVDRAFEEARIQVAAALAPLADLSSNGEPPPSGPSIPAPPPPPPLVIEAEEEIAVPNRSYDGLFESMEAAQEEGTDPINAFSPAPRMDWGPERSSKLRRNGVVKRTHPENA